MDSDSDHHPYAGRWVAMIGGRIISQGGTPQQALLAAKIARHKEIPTVIYVPTENRFVCPPLLARVIQVLADAHQVYLVGGAVRDMLLSRPVHDFDFVLQGEALQVARKVANGMGAAFFPLDEERQTARVIFTDEDGLRHVFDFAALRGPALEDDLQERDFTINAMAVDVVALQALLDPLGGAADLWNKVLRACSPSSFQKDPIRVLRAVRLAAGLNLRIHPETRAWMRAAVPLLVNESPERLRDEVFRILNGPQPHTAIRALEIMGALPHVFPEAPALAEVAQSPPHVKDVWGHTLDTLKNLESFLNLITSRHDPDETLGLILGLGVINLGRYRDQIKVHLETEIVPNRDIRSLLFLAALYHDIGKPLCRQMEEGGRIRFINHENVGAEILVCRGEELHLSKNEIERLKIIVRHHMRPAHLAREGRDPSRRAVYRYFRDTGEAGIDICLLSLADLLATYGTTLTQERWSRQLEVVRKLMDAWWQQPEKQVKPPAIVSGHDLMAEFNFEPGPQLGEVLEMIRESQAAGEISTRGEALHFVRQLLENGPH